MSKFFATALSCSEGSLVWVADRVEHGARKEHALGSSGLVSSAAVNGSFVASPLDSLLPTHSLPCFSGTSDASCALVELFPAAVKKQQEEEEMTLSNLTSASAGEVSVSSGNRMDGTNTGMPPTSSTPPTPTTTTVTVSSGQPLTVAVKRKRNLPGTPGAIFLLTSSWGVAIFQPPVFA